MGDSDDEYDRKRRDKFRGERSDYRDVRRPPPAGAGDDRRRDDWQDRHNPAEFAFGHRFIQGSPHKQDKGSDWNRGARGPPVRPMEYRLGGRPREFSPPNKRPRGEWDRYSHDSYASSGYGSGFEPQAPHGGYHGSSSGSQRDHSDGGIHVLSFKSWLSTQDDSISDQDALTKYAEYKQEFKRQQLNEFFVAHREEEWFKNKYHPDESSRRKEEQHQNLMKRVNIFMEFLSQNRFDDVTLDSPNSDKIAKLMDWYVIRLEGGSDEDAKKLLSDEPKPAWSNSTTTPSKPEVAKATEPAAGTDDAAEEVAANGSGKRRKSHNSASKDEDWSGASGSESDGGASPKAKKQKATTESAEAIKVEAEDAGTPMEHETENISADEEEKEAKVVKPKKVRTTSDSGHSNGPAEDGEDEVKSVDGDKKEAKEKAREVITISEPEGPPQLHRTASVFLRNLSPAVPKAEVEALCQKYPGFLRAALADPQPERRYYRRGWVTFKRDVNIKEICWQLNNIRVKDAELGAIVNRDLTRRVRCVSGITPHKTIVRNDIRLAAQVIQFLDSKWNLWDEDSNQDKKESFGVYSTNPVLKNITDYLIEEASAEEDELLGMGGGGGSDGEIDAEETKKGKNNEIDRDEELIKVLDRLVLYLRFVHSLDYYNHAEYPYEDDMPNRLGIMHGRGTSATGDVNLMELQEYNRNFEQKISTFCQKTTLLTEEEVKVMGMKDEASEVEKFIQANTQELGKDKWLCPLSGKKFKGPEFVRKHIENKHPEKLEEVKKEVAFFNNYLRDPKRPKTPERKDLTQTHYPPPQMGGPRREPIMMDRGDYHQPPFPPYGGGYGAGPGYGGGGYGGPPRGYQPYGGGGFGGPPRGRAGGYRGRGDGNRPMISYRDLDAPPDDDF